MLRKYKMQLAPRRTTAIKPIALLLGFAIGVVPALAADDVPFTIDGASFYASRGEVRNEKVTEVEGTSIALVTWDERVQGGDFEHHFGISLDGQSLVRVASTTYELGLRYAQFDPLVSIPDVPAEIAAADGNHLYLVQFITQPLEVFNRQIAERGGAVRQYVAQFAYLVEATPEAIEDIKSLPYVRWAGPYHPAYRLEEFMIENLDQAEALFPSLAYNIQVLTVGQKADVAGRVSAIGGFVQKYDAGKFLVEAVLTPDQLLQVAGWNEVLFIDRWGPFESDMNIARDIGGANYIENVAGFGGHGVRGEVFDTGFNFSHVDFASRPLVRHGGPIGSDSHGSSTSGITFGDGTGDPTARGLLPNGQGIVAAYQSVGLSGPSRYTHSSELVQAPYFAVFQTSSVGSPRTFNYTTISADSDATLFDFDISFCQSQSNAGNQDSRPQAWAKNIISGGGVRHQNTLTKADDCWCGGASTGPASDGRIKPTFTHFYDAIRTVTCCGTTSYTSGFGGTSGATPIICGHVGLFYEMWASGIFGNPVPQEGVFANRSHMTTAKAMLVNTADQYDWRLGGSNGDLTRVRQGWGMPSLRNLYDLRDQIFVIDETEVLEPFEAARYELTVAPGANAFKASMTYADPPGNPSVQTQHRINDLDLKVTSPSNVVYYGNWDLYSSPWSVTGGFPDDKNTVENVFIEDPEAGVWTVEVIATELIQDSHVETPALDADFALVVSPVMRSAASVGPAEAAPAGLRLAIMGMGPGIREARVSFELQEAVPVRLQVFDVTGRLVATVFEGQLPAGPHTLEWPGVDHAGNDVEAGVYFARIRAGAQAAHGKVLIIR